LFNCLFVCLTGRPGLSIPNTLGPEGTTAQSKSSSQVKNLLVFWLYEVYGQCRIRLKKRSRCFPKISNFYHLSPKKLMILRLAVMIQKNYDSNKF